MDRKTRKSKDAHAFTPSESLTLPPAPRLPPAPSMSAAEEWNDYWELLGRCYGLEPDHRSNALEPSEEERVHFDTFTL